MPTARKAPKGFGAGARTLPQHYLVSQDVFADERERIFFSQWLCLGHQSQIARAGEYFVQDLVGESLVLLRDRQGEARAFYNVCRHRGTRLCEEKSGQLRETLQCPYHAWTYGLDGRLVGAPHMDQVKGFDKAEHSLHAVRLAQWEGFIFANMEERPAPFATRFAPLMGKFTHWNLPMLRSARRIEYDVRANWKL